MKCREKRATGLYKIIRFFKDGGNRVVDRGLTLEEAQAHCRDIQSSSSTATSATAKRRTRLHGQWFDGYDDEMV